MATKTAPRFKKVILKDKLPNKLWQLLQVAVEDLLCLEQIPGFTTEMSTWIDSDARKIEGTKGFCQTCLAGAALVNHGLPLAEDFYYVSVMGRNAFGDNQRDKASAINNLRMGKIQEAHQWLYGHSADNKLLDAIYKIKVREIDTDTWRHKKSSTLKYFEELIADLKALDI